MNFDLPSRRRVPIALTIAGSDSGGGAGVQADLKTFAALGVHGTCAITCLTAQNPRRVLGIAATSPENFSQQLAASIGELPPAAAKSGMLYSSPVIDIVAEYFKLRRNDRDPLPLVVDPVMVATSGARLLSQEARKAFQRRLLPLATLVTPNVDEAQVLTGERLRSVEDLRRAARKLHDRFGCAVLVKGGHLRGPEAADIYFDGRTELLLTAPRLRGVGTHGTGCMYSAAITAFLARGVALPEAVARAKKFITRSIAQAWRVGRHDVLNPFH